MFFLIILVVAVCMILALYNQLSRQRLRIRETFKLIEKLQLKNYDLLPKLLDNISSKIDLSPDKRKEIMDLRQRSFARNRSIEEKTQCQNQLNHLMSQVIAEAAQDKDLAQDPIFLEQKAAWESSYLEQTRAFNSYNMIIVEYNSTVESFPSSIVAKLFKYEVRTAFELE